MSISLLISGNLTGFGRFYTSPAAVELLGSEKISLDNHSHLTFLGSNEKAYSITFAKRYIAISQYTQILDSFRRPGKLVISVLVPRNYMIVPNSGLPKGAVYSLLAKISDKFFEKNFQDGMINQNPAVLGQDYYSEILDGYSLIPSDNRRINEDPSPVKKIGYVRSLESDVPNYLDTPYRKSYGEGGYNLVFFAPSAPVGTPNSIDEEPVEVVLYKVRIMNTGAVLPNPVKLSAPLYKLQAKPGEKAFPIEGTYKDAVDHLLEPRITARIQPGEVVEVQYNFEKDEKTIKFVFVDMATSTPVSLDSVLPSISFADGSRQPISSETFTFRGSEIYDNKKLVADNPSVSISPRSERLDLSRLSDNQELKVYVQQGFNLPVEPNYTNLTITFVNKCTGETKSFSCQKMIHLPGSITDWNVYVDTDNYVAPIQAIAAPNGRLYIQGLQRKAKNVSKKAEAQMKPTTTDIAVQTNIPTLNLSDGKDYNRNEDKGKGHKVKWHKYIIILPVLLLVLGGIWWWIKSESKSDNMEVEYMPVQDCGHDTLKCTIIYQFSDGQRVRQDMYNEFVLRISDGEKDLPESCFVPQDYLQFVAYDFKTINVANRKYYIHISFIPEGYSRDKAVKLVDNFKISQDALDNRDSIFVDLGVSSEQIGWFKTLSEISLKQYKKEQSIWHNNVENRLKNSDFKEALNDLIFGLDKKLLYEGDYQSKGVHEVKYPKELNVNSSLKVSDLMKKYTGKGVEPAIKQRAEAMIEALTNVSKCVEVPRKVIAKLSDVQQKVVERYNRAIKEKSENTVIIQNDVKQGKIQSFNDLWVHVQYPRIKFDNEN